MVKVWNTTSKADPGIKLIQILEAIEEDHPEAYRRIKLETIDNDKFDKTNENVVEECLKTLDKYFGSSFNEIVAYAKKAFKDVRIFKPLASRKDSKENFLICKKLR